MTIEVCNFAVDYRTDYFLKRKILVFMFSIVQDLSSHQNSHFHQFLPYSFKFTQSQIAQKICFGKCEY